MTYVTFYVSSDDFMNSMFKVHYELLFYWLRQEGRDLGVVYEWAKVWQPNETNHVCLMILWCK